MLAAKFKYTVDPAKNTVKVAITPGSLLKITLQTFAWSVGPFVALILWNEVDERRNPKPSNTEDTIVKN